jgi:hypothetical protein
MREICVSPRTQAAVTLGALSGLVAVVVSQLPDIRRYLKIRSM